MAEAKGFSSLKDFVDSIRSLKYQAFLARNLPESKVAKEDHFTDMQTYILNLYDKTEALHSFMDEGGAIYDCIPVEQQSSLRGSRGGVPSAPDAPEVEVARGPKDERQDSLVSPLGPDKKDRFGNVMQCGSGTIPMRRVTMEDLARFETLKDFFRKGPGETGRPPQSKEPTKGPATHRWAHAFQNVSNGGGHKLSKPLASSNGC